MKALATIIFDILVSRNQKNSHGYKSAEVRLEQGNERDIRAVCEKPRNQT
jgi:hypothetical protein